MAGKGEKFAGALGMIVLIVILNILSHVFNWGWIFY